ncbi:MAG TPA: metabolite traffic protein EboE [Planctomycetota bacterium]|nr:metabolite traffic protein EboE [Planctomycetota bacterium]
MPVTLAYCTNLFPSETLADVSQALVRFGAPLRRRLGATTLPLGLCFSARAARELEAPGALEAFAGEIASLGLRAATLNAFPYGGFHATRVKEDVFRPTWEEPARAEHTERACRLLAALLPPGATGAVSTHTGTFKEFGVGEEGDARIARAWLRLALSLARLEDETGRRIVLSVEPEPLSRLETSAETVRFFESLWTAPLRRAAAEWSVSASWLEAAARRHVGVCFDVCHQSVEFEDPPQAMRRLAAAGITIGKMQASIAPRLERPSERPDGLARLAAFAEPRWLHQTFALAPSGELSSRRDLPDALADVDFLRHAQEIRTHFHLPIFLEASGPLATTRRDLERACEEAASRTSCVEVETYTLASLPEPPVDDAAVVETMARELEFAARACGLAGS